MDRNTEQQEALVDLGQASVETQGNGIYPYDTVGLSLTPTAIRDDE
jgi:hypothetical protein